MRTRVGVSKYLGDGVSIYTSTSPSRIPRPSAGGMLVAFFLGAALFVLFCLVFIAVFAP